MVLDIHRHIYQSVSAADRHIYKPLTFQDIPGTLSLNFTQFPTFAVLTAFDKVNKNLFMQNSLFLNGVGEASSILHTVLLCSRQCLSKNCKYVTITNNITVLTL